MFISKFLRLFFKNCTIKINVRFYNTINIILLINIIFILIKIQ